MAPITASVLIPCYNNREFIGEAIESALAQTHQPTEVVVIDDGSTDDSWSEIQKFGDRIIAARQENAGACAARNHALRLSSGRFIQFLDADDRIQPQKIERQLAEFDAGDIDASICLGNIFGDGKPLRPKKAPVSSPDGRDPFVFICGQSLSTPSSLFRREVVERVGGFRVGVPRAQERDFYLRLSATGVRLRLLREQLYDVRNDARDDRITRKTQHSAYFLELLFEIRDILFSGPPYEMSEERRAALAGLMFQQSIHAYRNGVSSAASRGFQAAYRLSRRFQYRERSWYKFGARIAGPMAMERLLAAARTCRGVFVKA